MGEPNRWSEMNLQWSKDLGRSIDYLETRPDIDTGKLAFYGTSLGAAMAPRLIAVERRFKAGVMLMGGSFEKVPPGGGCLELRAACQGSDADAERPRRF